MRNMKRALSLVLTMVMLLGMFMIPTGAAGTFTDAHLIENTEAVQITSGIGLFAGTTEGEFAPKATVTRAQMATIIVKMLRGSNFNADAFKGVDKFPDTASFEGGWAEGYINACVQLGVVAGYGDGTFKPGKAVTTAEALTMIINALGVNPGPGEWPLTYMAKAEAMKLYGDLAAKPATNAPLNRDQLAVIVWEGLQYSPEGKSGYKIPGSDLIFTDIADAVLANGNNFEGITEAVGQDSLASKVYEIKTATGWVTGNAATGEPCTVLTSASGVETNYAIETGVDMLGHYATIYYNEQYKNDEEPGQVYTIVDESTVVTVKEAIDTAKEYKAAFGKSINVAQNGLLLGSDYTVTEKLGNDLDEAVALLGYTAGSAAPKGTYIIADGVIVAYIEPATVYASYISSINTVPGNEKVYIGGVGVANGEGDDMVVEYAGMANGDYVTYVIVNGVYVLSPVTKVSGAVTKTSTTEINGETYSAITLDGTLYPAFEPQGTSPSNNNIGRKLDNDLSLIQYGQNYTLYITEDGHYVGFESVEGAISLDNTVYLLGNIIMKEKDQYGKTAFYNKGRGVDMSGAEVMILLGKALDVSGDAAYQEGEDAAALGSMDTVLEGFYTVKDSIVKEEKKEGIQVAEAFSGIYSPDAPTYALNTYSSEKAFVGTNWISTMDGIAAAGSGTTKYLFISGGLNDSAPLTVKIMTGSISPAIALTTADPDKMLVTRAGARNNIEVFVRVAEEDTMRERIYVYATQEQLDNAAMVAEGTSYTVYSCSTGKTTEVIVGKDEAKITVPGFACLKEVDEDTYAVEESGINLRDAHQSTSEEDIYVLIANNGLWGLTSQRLRFERMVGVNGEKAINGISNTVYNNSKASSVPVIDLRDEDEFAASGVDQILNMSQLIALQETDPGLMAIFDFAMYGSYRSHEAKAVFLKKVVRDTIGMNAIVYVESFGSDSDGRYANGIAASARNAITGDEVKVYADRIVEAGTGFYRYSVDANGNIALVPFDVKAASLGNYGMFGIHETISSMESIDAGTLLVKTADSSHDCDVSCADAAFEALKNLYVTADTMIYDAVAGEWIELDELIPLYRKNQLEVDIFCAMGVYNSGENAQKEKDDSVDMLVIREKVAYKISCDGEHEGWTPISEAGAITTPGKYYLTQDITGVVSNYGLSIDCADVTLCLCGYDIAPASKGNGAVRVQNAGSSLELVNCSPFGGEINASGMEGGRAMYIAKGASATMRDAVVMTGASTTDTTNAAVQVQQGTFNMYGGAIRDNSGSSKNNCCAVWVSGSGATFNMYGGAISGNTNTKTFGGGVSVTKDATFNMYGGEISGNKAFLGGAGVNVVAGGTFNLVDGVIKNNEVTKKVSGEKSSGAGVNCAGTFTMSGGEISGNKTATGNTSYEGGGVCIGTGGTFTMTGGIISGNTTQTGGGVVNYGTFTMTDGTITDNYAGGMGGGVCTSGAFTMSGGHIDNNDGNQAGGVFIRTAVTFTMTGGTINGNQGRSTSSGGGGVYVNSGEFKMSGDTEIKNNTSKGFGGGIYVDNSTKVTISGGTVTGNTGAKGGDCIYKEQAGSTITITAGTFDADPTEYVNADTHTVTEAGGKYTVAAK